MLPTKRTSLLVGIVNLLLSTQWVKADEELTPETRALVAKLREDMKSKTVATRATAYKSMGELGEKAKGQRRALCEGMLDPNATVQTAAADALKKVDEPIYKLALGVLIDRDDENVRAAGKLGEHAEPLAPLILKYANSLAPLASKEPGGLENIKARRSMRYCVESLVVIAPNDDVVNRAVIAMLGNPSPTLRALSVDHISPLKNKKLALKGILAITANASEEASVRARAVSLAPALVDENTAPATKKAIEALRFDKAEIVREAVGKALQEFK